MKDSDPRAAHGEPLIAVERGKTNGVSKQGRRAARLAPETDFGQAAADGAVDNLAKFRERAKKAPLAEALGACHQGHKY
jgi:hypothetical protein